MTAITEDERQLFERVEKVIRENFRQMMHHLWGSWCHLGIDSETRYKRTEDLIGFTEDFHREVKMETDYKCQKLKEEIEALKAESAQLSRCLSIEISLTECYDGTPMYLEKNALEEQLKGYRRELQDRKTKITRLSEWQNDLCTALGTTFVEIADDPLPSEVELNKLKDHLEMLQEERDKRMTVFLNKQKDVKDLMAELGIQPVLKFEQEVVKSLSVEFKVTDRNMAKLCELHESLGMQLEETKNRVLELRERLHMLWERLEEEPCYRSNFLDAYPGCKPETEKALRDEIARCEEKKRQNIKVFVAKMRMEIKHLWDKCLYSNKEREEFYHYNCDVFTEDTLTLHELYLEKIQKYYAEIEPIYNLLQVRNDLWQKMLELEARANEPGRLHNRGGQLLKEEKERKTIASKLPKIETQLMELVKEHEMKCGKVFTVHGAPLMEKIAEEWEKRKMERQNKQSARKHQGGLTPSTPLVKNSMMLSPLGKRNMTAASLMRNNRTTTPAKKALLMVASASKLLTSQACNGLKRSAVTSVKRTTHQPPRQLVQDGAGPSLRRKLRYSGGRSDARSPHKVTIPKITVSGNTLKTKRLSGKHRSSTHRRNSHSRRLSKGLRAASSEDEAKKNQPVPPHSDSTMMTSYTDFQEHLHENTSSRSSLVPGRLLRARQNKENMNPNTIYENGTPNFKNKTTNIKQKQPLTPKSNMIMEVALAVTPNRVTRASLQKNNSTLLNVFATPRPPANKLKPQQQLQRQNTMTLSCPKMANQLMTRSNSTHNLKSPKLQMAKNLPLII